MKCGKLPQMWKSQPKNAKYVWWFYFVVCMPSDTWSNIMISHVFDGLLDQSMHYHWLIIDAISNLAADIALALIYNGPETQTAQESSVNWLLPTYLATSPHCLALHLYSYEQFTISIMAASGTFLFGFTVSAVMSVCCLNSCVLIRQLLASCAFFMYDYVRGITVQLTIRFVFQDIDS